MRIDRLDLTAFGPFTDLSLDLSGGRRGLHLLFGPNEAGKSSALRAVRAALFGFERTGENFLHPYEKLRVGMAVSEGDRRLAFVRRKGNKETLRDTDDRDPLPDDALRPFLGNVSETVFDRLFGLTRAELREGGDALLAASGEVGQLLFSATGGLTRLQAVRDNLNAEAERLFLPGGTAKREINNALRDWSDRHGEVTREQLNPEDYRRGRRHLETLRGRLDELADRRAAVRDRRDARRTRRSLRLLAEQLTRDEARLTELGRSAAADGELTAAAATIRELAEDAVTVRKEARDRGDHLAEIAEHEVQGRSALTELTGARADADADADAGTGNANANGNGAPRLTAAQRAAVRDAVARHGELRRDADAAAKELREAREARDALAARLGELPDAPPLADLIAALEPARACLSSGEAPAAAAKQAARRRRDLDRHLARLPLWGRPRGRTGAAGRARRRRDRPGRAGLAAGGAGRRARGEAARRGPRAAGRRGGETRRPHRRRGGARPKPPSPRPATAATACGPTSAAG